MVQGDSQGEELKFVGVLHMHFLWMSELFFLPRLKFVTKVELLGTVPVKVHGLTGVKDSRNKHKFTS